MTEEVRQIFEEGGSKFLLIEVTDPVSGSKTVFTTNREKRYFEDLLFAVRIAYGLEKTYAVLDSGRIYVEGKKVVVWGESVAYGKGDRKATLKFLRDNFPLIYFIDRK